MAHIDCMGPGALTRVFSSCRHPARGSYKYATSAQCAINACVKMTWFGATDAVDLRRHMASHISSQTTRGVALVTDLRGSLLSSSVTETEFSTLSGSTSNIQAQLAGMANNFQLQLGALDSMQPALTTGILDISHVDGLQDGLDAKQATIEDGDIEISHVAGRNEAFGNFITWGSIEITDVTGLMDKVFGTNMSLIAMQNSLNLKSDVRALETYQHLVTTNSLSMSIINGLVDHVIETGMTTGALNQATAELAARVVELEARSIVAGQSVIITDNLDWANVNAPLVYHKYKTNRTDASISYIKTAASLSLINLAITASAPTSIALTGTDRKEQFCILQSGCIRRPHVT